MMSCRQVCPYKFSASLIVLLFLVVLSPARAQDCWSKVAEAADPDLTVTVNSTEKVTVRQILARGQELTPPMMVLKALAGIDHFMRNPQCLSVYTDSLDLLGAYIAYRSAYKEEEWRDRTDFSFADAATAELAKVRRLSENLIATDNPEKLPEMIQQGDRSEGTWFRSLVGYLDRNDLARITVPCQTMRDSMLWRSAMVTRMDDIHEQIILQQNYCSFVALKLDAVVSYEKSIIATFGEPYYWPEKINRIITNPRGLLESDARSDPPPWAYFSAWNWVRWVEMNRLLAPAVAELAAFYESKSGLDKGDARNAASAALLGLRTVERTLPIPSHDLRALILDGRPLSQIASHYPPTVRDGFDECDYRQLDKQFYSWFPGTQYPFDERDNENCYVSFELAYRWEEHLALIGTPEPPLLIAVLRPDVVTWLLDAGEDIEQVNQYGKTALMTAVHLNQMETVRLLLARRADVNHRTYGEIKRDASQWDERIYLSDTIRKPRSLRHAGRTAIMYAAENADAEIVDMLLSAGADPCLADSKGLVPSDYFDGKAPSRQANLRVQDKATRERLIAALSCPTEKRILPAPFPQPTPPETP